MAMITPSYDDALYLVVDPSADEDALERGVRQALEGGTDIVQLWNHWPAAFSRSDKAALAARICGWAHEAGVPVLINEEWPLLQDAPLDGVHFDRVPGSLRQVREAAGRPLITGITCSNDLDTVRWADAHGLDYISFCAMFPSPSAGRCDIVKPETVRRARTLTDLPFFVSGGITPENIGKLDDVSFSGVAVISGIMGDPEPRRQAGRYKEVLRRR